LNLIKIIDKNLDKFLPSANKEPGVLHRAMRHSVFSGGKRIRPVVLIEAAIACGGASGRGAIPAACAIELAHTYSLIHDDLPSMDDDDYRRGKPSCHKKFGEANAILAGDALLTLAFGILAGKYPAGISAAMVKELSSAIGSEGMVGGQALDIAKSRHTGKINYLKTAKLFEASAVLGALSAGAGDKKIEAVRGYGANLGIAFQAVDDILDGEAAASHKSAEIFTFKAKTFLIALGNKANGLKKIADRILNRTK
jgi:geranylgeranyl diphosphate synthase type II